jgi:hypothetical protein
MSKTAASQPLLQLLVRVYNQSIQTYFHFPDVIICGQHRLEETDFHMLLSEGYIEVYYMDSFGKLYRLSKKAHNVLQYGLYKRKAKHVHSIQQNLQAALPFS